MTPKELQKIVSQHSSKLPLKECLLMSWRPRICPYHLLINAVPQNTHVLDVGCGTGLMLFLLSYFGRICHGIGIEVIDHKIEIAKSLPWGSNNMDFHHLKPEEDWPSKEVDCIIMIDVLHHIPLQEQKAFIERINQTPAKTIIFKDINPQKKFKCMMNTIHDLILSRQYPHYRGPEIVSNWLKDMGFKKIEISHPEMLWYSHYLIVAHK